MLRNLLAGCLPVALSASLLWGACVSCQELLAPASAADSCCTTAGHCTTPGKMPAPAEPNHRHCSSPALPLQQIVKADEGLSAKLELVLAPVSPSKGALAAPAARPVSFPLSGPLDYSPPDLFRLHSAFLI